MNRREFVRRLAGAAALGVGGPGLVQAGAAQRAARPAAGGRPKKGVLLDMLPKDRSLEDRLKLARDVGFEGIEAPPLGLGDARELRAAAEKAGIPVHAVIFGGWGAPLSSGDPKVAETGLKQLEAALHGAREMGADTVLLVPGIVNEGTRYEDAYRRSQERIRTLIPVARRLGVVIAIENVWNNFLLSPMEFARYVDEFRSPFVQAYFDVGNVVVFGWPEDWIRTLGRRIRKIHLKDFTRGRRAFVPLREGDVNWPAVRKALADVGFADYMTVELGAGDEAYLREVSARVDQILAGA